MDNFTTIYKILSYLEKAMDYDQPDWRAIGAEHLGINENRWRHIMKMLIDNGYIEGVAVLPIMGSGFDFKFINPAITLAGLSYLECCCSPFLSLPCPRHLPKPAPMFCRITA